MKMEDNDDDDGDVASRERERELSAQRQFHFMGQPASKSPQSPLACVERYHFYTRLCVMFRIGIRHDRQIQVQGCAKKFLLV